MRRLAPAKVTGAASPAFNLAGISTRDARLNYSDEADGSRYRVEQLQLTTGAVRDGAPFDLSTSFRLTDLADNSGGACTAQGADQRRGWRATSPPSVSPRLDAELDTIGLGGLEALSGTPAGAGRRSSARRRHPAECAGADGRSAS